MSTTNLTRETTTTTTTTTSQSRGIVNASEARVQCTNREDPTVFQVPIHQPVPSIGTLMNIKRRMARWRTRGRDNILGSTKSSIAMQGTRLRMENSYVLRPKEEERFSEEKVERIVRDVLVFHLSNSNNYDAKSCAKLACRMTEDIKSRVKELRYTRYKVVAYVVVGKMNGQGTHLGSRGLWDTTCDGMASASMTTAQQLFGVGVVFATYFE